MPIVTYPIPENITGVGSAFGYTNSITGQLFVPIMLFVFWFILFITLKQWRTEAALGASTFITMMITMMLRVITFSGQPLISDGGVLIMILAFIASFFLVVFSNEKYG